MKYYKVLYTPEAKSDLKSIYRYIAFSLKEKGTAINLVNRIRDAIKKLNTSPDRYAPVDWEPWKSMGMRYFPVGNYVVYYYVNHEDNFVMVNRIFYGGRDVQNIAHQE
jgi:plasmid stabilization system protein ParE